MSKTELFEKDLQELSAIFKALSHPARLAILKYLAETRVCISGDISDELPLSRTTVIQHLTELKRLELIKGQIEGVKTNYCLNPDRISSIGEVINSFIKDIDCCTDNEC
jgi:DNA-binding transcriptional ArsR family regulator